MLRLSIDCADRAVSCAVTLNGQTLGHSLLSSGQTHSQTLIPQIMSALECAGVSLKQVDEVAITVGPGSFTGLRIGIAATKGLCFADGKSCRAVSTLHSIAAAAGSFEGIVCAVMDARCNQVYNALFEYRGGVLSRICDDRAVMLDELGAELSEYARPVLLIGPGAQLGFSRLSDKLNCLSVREITLPDARYVATVADLYQLISAEQLTPSYLRLPQAERELKARLNTQNGGNNK